MTTFTRGLANFAARKPRSTVVTVGTFDGIHRGHQEIFRRVREAAVKEGLESVLVTFHPHPRMVVSPDNVPMLLTSIEEKEKFVPRFFDGTVLVVDFDDSIRNLSAAEFVRQVLVETAGVRRLVVGYDHHLGKDRSGNIDELRRLGKESGFEVEVVGPVLLNDAPISSTRIRQALTFGEYNFAVELLGHDYAVYGKVERGIGLGRKLGYPTANIAYSPRKLLPPEGVYACWALVGGVERNGMMFVGQNHFNPEARLTVEANIFDFDADLYGQEVVVYPTEYIRANRAFASTDELVAQIAMDKKNILDTMKKGDTKCQ